MSNYITNSGVLQQKTSKIESIQIIQHPLRACRSWYVLVYEKVPCFGSPASRVD